ncbi:MAG: sulfur carrier protein ThiS [Frankiaceae bacterium]|nr:sulfur carrier protein ThiS [Frankiaceae bacterium]MBV9872688.1 sulfur carrier protein ThiS [Frankiaceae bacterium]
MSDFVVNGESRPHAPGTTIADVVRSLSPTGEGCAVAVNAAVVPRSSWPTRTVEPGDAIEVLTAVQGG